MKAILSALLMFGFAQTAMASHPHDRVCVASAPGEIGFVFQYSIGRSYENGDPSKDPHIVAAEAAYSVGDYMVNPGVKFTTVAQKVNPQAKKMIAIVLKSATGAVLFDGTFDFANERLAGTFTGGVDNKSYIGRAALTCVSQPRLTLETSQDDIAL